MVRPSIVFVALITLCFSLGVTIAPTVAPAMAAGQSSGGGAQSDSLVGVILGDSRGVLGSYFFDQADAYFHSGYYPSFFDRAREAQRSQAASHLKEHHDDDKDGDSHEPEFGMDFLGKPRDLFDRFGRNFYPSTHSHLDKPGEAREILPWLKLSADADPHNVATYTVASWWLRDRLGKVRESERFLREGFRANQDSYEILLELGNLYYENYHDPFHARNMWDRGLKLWHDQDAAGKNPDIFDLQQLNTDLAKLEENEGDYAESIKYLEAEKAISPNASAVQARIDELKQKMAAGSGKK